MASPCLVNCEPERQFVLLGFSFFQGLVTCHGSLPLNRTIKMGMNKKISYPIARRLFAMRRYGGGMLYAALPLHIQRGCFRIRTHDQQVTKAQLYRCTKARPHKSGIVISNNHQGLSLIKLVMKHNIQCSTQKS